MYDFKVKVIWMEKSQFFDSFVLPEMILKWKSEKDSLSRRDAEISLFGYRPFHTELLDKVR